MKTIYLWVAVCTSPAQDSCTVMQMYKAEGATAMVRCQREEARALPKLLATGASIKHGCKTIAQFEKEGL